MTDKNEGRLLINIPADEKYIEILGYRIDGFESLEAFLEHLKKYAELEETVNHQKAEIDALKELTKKNQQCIKEKNDVIDRQKAEIERLEDLNKCYYTSCQQTAKSNHEIKAEAVKEFTARVKETLHYAPTVYQSYFLRIVDATAKEMEGES